MYARSTTFHVPSDKIDTYLKHMESSRSGIEQQHGYMGGYFMIDRKSGKALSLTLWDSEQSLRASQDMANQILSQLVGTLGLPDTPRFDIYEVGVEIPTRMRKAA